MATTLNPAAPVWSPRFGFSSASPRDSAPSTPSPFSLNAAPFVPWSHQEFHPAHGFQSFHQAPSYPAQYHEYAPPPYQEWSADSYCFSGNKFHSGLGHEEYGSAEGGVVDPNDPFALQMRQVEKLKADGYYPSWSVKPHATGDNLPEGSMCFEATPWAGEDGMWMEGMKMTKRNRNKKFGKKNKAKASDFETAPFKATGLGFEAATTKTKGKKKYSGWMSKDMWEELGMHGEWKTKEQWDESQKLWLEKRKRDAEKWARKDSGVAVGASEGEGEKETEEGEGVEEQQ